jgi:UDP-2,3-diacylglucosamine hydrolase
MKRSDKLAIIAGFGSLPSQVINDATDKGWDVTVFSINGSFKISSNTYEIIEIPNLNIKKIFSILQKHNIKNITMVGYITRPNDMSAYFNFSNIFFYLKFKNIINSGDSSLFNNLVKYIEGKGYNIIGAHQISSNLTLSDGLYSNAKVSNNETDNIRIAYKVAKKIGNLDIGQSVVVSKERILAVEAAEGTNSMLERVCGLRSGSTDKSGVFLKTSQNIQDNRLDMPTIGPKTVELVIKANLSGVAITKGDVIVLEYEKIIHLINENNLFFIVIDDFVTLE